MCSVDCAVSAKRHWPITVEAAVDRAADGCQVAGSVVGVGTVEVGGATGLGGGDGGRPQARGLGITGGGAVGVGDLVDHAGRPIGHAEGHRHWQKAR